MDIFISLAGIILLLRIEYAHHRSSDHNMALKQAGNIYMKTAVATYPSGLFYIHDNIHPSRMTLEDLPATGTIAVDNQVY